MRSRTPWPAEIDGGLDSLRLRRARRDLRESMRATRAAMNAIKADSARDAADEVKHLDAKLIAIEWGAGVVLARVAALLRNPSDQRSGLERDH